MTTNDPVRATPELQENETGALRSTAGELMEVHATQPASSDSPPTSGAVLSAVASAASVAPAAAAAIMSAAEHGSSLRVEFPPEVMRGLRNGTLHLLQTKSGQHTATAVDSASSFVANGRVVGDAGRTAVTGATVASGAVIMLPIAVAAIASYQQQQQLERALKDIQASLNRIEERMKDEEHGVCDAAESFISVATRSLASGALPPYLRSELAGHRVRVEGVYAARRRYVERFKRDLERQQIEHEQKKGERQPWVDQVQELAKDGRLEEELVLFVRALIVQSRLDAFAALCLADDGAPELAAQLLYDSQIELRTEFFDLHNRLVPLARIAPSRGLLDRVPLVSRNLERAHEITKSLVAQLDQRVLPEIPDPRDEQPVVVELSSEDVRSVAAHLSS